MEKNWVLRWSFVVGLMCLSVEGIGVNWGTQATHKWPQHTVVQMLKDNGIKKVKLFDSDDSTMSALAGTGIELAEMNDYARAKQWVKKNVTRYNFNGGVNVK
ncbi:hypothetical protein JHK82_023808 [Glycine max]|nr:hypothetical protein JHK85_024371 [Glycine max]KAG5011617.1 hypothetical protein JHK86_023878 [Glycine max]KAG5132620.1 hypothetical protein JHK82_023808 [Glycine max]